MGTHQHTEPQASGLNRAMRREIERQQRRRPARPQRGPMKAQNGTELAIELATKLTHDERTRMLQPVRDSFTALRQGVATYDQWAYVSSAITVAQAIEQQGIVKGLREHLDAAERAIDAVWHRVEEDKAAPTWGRRTTLHFDEINAIREAIHLHDWQLQQLSVREFREAVGKARHNVRNVGGREIHVSAVSLPPPIQQRLV